MADSDYYIKPHKLTSQFPQNPENPYKFYNQFMYKALIVAIFLVIIPFLPSQAPDFINQSLHTRGWELLQLLLVGIAISYGLSSRKADETEKEHSSKFDNAQSYVSRLLQVSSVFDDETDSPTGFDENKVQTWNSQYFRGEPVVVVAQENSVLDEQSGSVSLDKPLLLPVRSLKSRVSHSDVCDTNSDSIGKGGSLSRSSSNLGSKRFSNSFNKSRNGEFGGSTPMELEEEAEENVVLRSPIPWRSRSGRMEMKEEIDGGVPLYSLPPSMEENEYNSNRRESGFLRSQSSRSARSPNKISQSLSSSSQSQAKNVEEVPRQKIYYKSSPPPAPPTPPPPPPAPLYIRKPPLVKSNSTLSKPEVFPTKELKRSVRSVPMELSANEAREMKSRASLGAESWPRAPSEGSLVGKSVRTTRSNEAIHESIPSMSKPSFVYYESEGNQEFEEKVVVETDEEISSEDDDGDDFFEGGSENEKKEVVSNNVTDGGPDVDKKADEFIAKFREQIRLQRIESIKRSTGQVARNSTR